MSEHEETVGGPGHELRYRADPDGAASDAVVAAIEAMSSEGEAEHDDAMALPPLYDAVDTDALNRLFDSAGSEGASELSVTFEYADYLVSVEAGGLVTVRSHD